MTRPKTKYRYYHGEKDVGRPSRSASPEKQPRSRTTVGEQRQSFDEEGTSPDLSPSGYVGSSSILSICPRFSPVISRKPAHPRDKDPWPFDAVKQQFRKLLASPERVDRLITQYYNSGRFTVIPRPLVLDPISALLRELIASQNEEAILDHHFQNARRNLHKRFPSLSAHTTVPDFLGYFTAENFRLEFVGLIFALAGVSVFYSQQSLAAEMYTASKICVGICEEYNQVNDLTVWSRFMNFILASILFGDANDEEVLLESSRLDAALQGLDRDGWKCPNGKDKPIRPASLIRLRYQQAHLRDKILRLSLGNRTQTFSETLSYAILTIYHALLIDTQDFVRRVSGRVVKGSTAIPLQRKRLGNIEPAIMRGTFNCSSGLSLQWILD
ncbi:uncharacterized protein NFIA_087790 [Aspergillus fischeri NRRL 181]|uniref:Transcription factor domain-containing protein n=1 Tax=Neosartorya fischeri (strain ATCC 1020 / DSM 3700 / CBS 544.65 / FGSC A1164 / JCM 1740 / NRRL 181 / WB 181) TaxID=331117 RepID=A1DHG6_NEOFI|nr:uncharacterized protein NFIA_087790 [Aspergillus fischeri NRRL 181]EAW18823.1 hypothetical protein NFIA_087790 [Aspergillus fischeri NRRL 181]